MSVSRSHSAPPTISTPRLTGLSPPDRAPCFYSGTSAIEADILAMHSRISAAPRYQVGKLIPRDNKQSFSPAAFDEDEIETELALDFRGYRHIDTSEDGDETYTLQNDECSAHLRFAMPGQASANALRNYLSGHLQPCQIVDEYGDECDISSISNDHLAVLQAKMWSKAPNSRSSTKAALSRPSRAQILVAGHVARIFKLLEGMRSSFLSHVGANTMQRSASSFSAQDPAPATSRTIELGKSRFVILRLSGWSPWCIGAQSHPQQHLSLW